MASAPTAPPPQGGDQDRAAALIAIYWVFGASALSVTLLRLYVRRTIDSLGRDDWIMAFTTLVFTALCVVATILALKGGTRHAVYLSPAQLSSVVRLNWIAQPFGIMALATAKVSVAFFMLRIIGPGNTSKRWLLYACIVSVLLINILCSIFSFVQCNPPRALWEEVPGSKCWNPKTQSDFSVFTGSWNAFIDVFLALLPITIVWNLQLNLEKRLGLCILLGLGIFAAISAAIKTSTLASLNKRSDLTWATYKLYVWTGAEIFLLIVCGSIPTLKPLYERISAHKQPKASYQRTESSIRLGKYEDRSGSEDMA